MARKAEKARDYNPEYEGVELQKDKILPKIDLGIAKFNKQ